MSLNAPRRPTKHTREGVSHRKNIETKKESSETCAHGISLADVCETCVQESRLQQPVWDKLATLLDNSTFKRSGTGPECSIERDGITYEVSMVRADDEKTIQEIQTLMEETFGEEEVDPIEVLKAGIAGKCVDGSKDLARYRLYVARDESGTIQSLYSGGLVEMQDPDETPNGESMFMISYGITRKEARRKGILRELHLSSMMQAAADAHAQDKKLSVVVGECTSSSEHAWNAVGLRRSYVESDSNEYSELHYIQPALDFDLETGLPAEDAGEAPEHIMMQFLEGGPDKNRISSVVDGMYRWCNIWPENAFANPRAYEAHRQYVERLQRQFDNFMSSQGTLLLLTAAEREDLRSQGVTIKEYTEADHGEDVSENA